MLTCMLFCAAVQRPRRRPTLMQRTSVHPNHRRPRPHPERKPTTGRSRRNNSENLHRVKYFLNSWNSRTKLGLSSCQSIPNSFPLIRKLSKFPWISVRLRRNYRTLCKFHIFSLIHLCLLSYLIYNSHFYYRILKHFFSLSATRHGMNFVQT